MRSPKLGMEAPMTTAEETTKTAQPEKTKKAKGQAKAQGIALSARSDFSMRPIKATGGSMKSLVERDASTGKFVGGKTIVKRSGQLKVRGNIKKQEPSATIYPLTLLFESRAQREEVAAVLQNMPTLHHEKRQQAIDSAISFLEDKPEIFNHDSLAFHILQNAKFRNEFMCEVGALTSQEVAELGQSQARNRASFAHRLKAENKVFAVEYQGEQRYPAFQFDPESGKPKVVVKEILELLKDEWSGWQLALWFITPNGYLDGLTPFEMMDAAPETVLNALRKETGEIEF